MRILAALRICCFASLCAALVAPGASAAAPRAAVEDPPEEIVVIWGGEEHRTRQSLEAWLNTRGASYELWAERHPAAAERIESAPGSVAPPAATSVRGASPPPAEPKWSTPAGRLVLGLLGLGVVLLVLGALFASPLILAVPPRRAARALHATALEVAGTGTVALVAAAVAYTLVL
jgi:hypothetical protein